MSEEKNEEVEMAGTTIVGDGLTQTRYFQKKKDAEKPHGEWNKIEIIAEGGRCRHVVNGVLVNEATDASVSKGKILLQSEGAEVSIARLNCVRRKSPRCATPKARCTDADRIKQTLDPFRVCRKTFFSAPPLRARRFGGEILPTNVLTAETPSTQRTRRVFFLQALEVKLFFRSNVRRGVSRSRPQHSREKPRPGAVETPAQCFQ